MKAMVDREANIPLTGGHNDFDYPDKISSEGEPIDASGYTFYDAGLEMFYNPVNAIVSYRNKIKNKQVYVSEVFYELANAYYSYGDYSNAIKAWDEALHYGSIWYELFSTTDYEHYGMVLASDRKIDRIHWLAHSETFTRWPYRKVSAKLRCAAYYLDGNYGIALWYYWMWRW